MKIQPIYTNLVFNFQEESEFACKGNRVWFGTSLENGTVEIRGNDTESTACAVHEAIFRLYGRFVPATTRFELIPILDELDAYGGSEGDLQLSAFDISDPKTWPWNFDAEDAEKMAQSA